MTCIVGIVKDGKVYIGGDSLGSNGHTKSVFPRPKVFKNGDFIIGYTSSYRMGQLLEATFEPPERLLSENDDFKFLISKVVPAIKTCFSEAGFEATEDGQKFGGCFLLGYKHKLYKVQAEYSLLEIDEAATGSGETFALGSLYSTKDNITPEHRIEEAINAAAYHCVSVGGPVHIVSD